MKSFNAASTNFVWILQNIFDIIMKMTHHHNIDDISALMYWLLSNEDTLINLKDSLEDFAQITLIFSTALEINANSSEP